MKSISKWLVVVTVLMAVTVYAQAPKAPPAQTPSAPAAQEEKAFTGALVKIDTATKLLTAKGADDKEMQFTYTDATQVVGAERTIQGLASKTGAALKITYRVQDGKNHATRIEMTQ